MHVRRTQALVPASNRHIIRVRSVAAVKGMTMLGHLVLSRDSSADEGYTHVDGMKFGWLRRVLGALFRRH